MAIFPVNNAGILAVGAVLDADPADIERDLRTNYLGTPGHPGVGPGHRGQRRESSTC